MNLNSFKMAFVYLSALLVLGVLAPRAQAETPALQCYELRTYYAAEGKFDALQARFANHTVALFRKHGIEQIAYWTPLPSEGKEAEAGSTLIYLLAYPDREARERSWKAFFDDPEWQAAKEASEREGQLVARVDSLFLHLTSYSPTFELKGGNQVFELRRYTTLPGKLPTIDARFRDHTIALFAKHGMTNLHYFHLDKDQEHADTTLLYFLAHDSAEARDASFQAFRSDPAWIAAREASEKDGPILIENGVFSQLLQPTAYSPWK